MSRLPGRLVYVMGPSGAGKDSVLRYARERVARYGILFAHRYITRAPHPGDENFVALSPAEFEERRDRRLFAFSWEAHGCSYGIGAEIGLWLKSGATVVVSGSRAHFDSSPPADAMPVLITASAATLAERLAARGRESEAAIRARLERPGPACAGAVEIDNSGKLEVAGEAFVAMLARVGRPQA